MSQSPTPLQLVPDSTGTITPEDLERLNSSHGLHALLKAKKIKTGKILRALRYEAELEKLQV